MHEEKFQKLQAFFAEIDQGHITWQGQFDYLERYDVDGKRAAFVPSHLTHIKQGLDQLVEEGIIDTSKGFLDGGCGDGRILALMGLYGNALGVEFNKDKARLAIRNTDALRPQGLFAGDVNVAVGDFTDDTTYDQAGVPFSSIGTIFNYNNNYEELAKKIVEESPEGTSLLVYHIGKKELDGLTHVKTLKVSDPNITFTREDPSTGADKEVPQVLYIQVYRKEAS